MLAAPAMAGPVNTKLDQMLLTGPNPFGGADITVTMDANRSSYGQIASDVNFPAESFFDVYIEVDIPTYDTYVLKAGESGVHMAAEIVSIPPPQATEYVNEDVVAKLLASDNDLNVRKGIILEVVHFTGGLTDIFVSTDGTIREYFSGSSADIRVQLDEFGPDTLDIHVEGSYEVLLLPRPVPSSNAYGIMILALLLIATGVYVYYRRRGALSV